MKIPESVLLWLVAIAATSCGGPTFKAPQHSHEPLLDKLNQPPLNLPKRQVATPLPAPASPGADPLQLLVDQPLMLVVMNGRVVSTSLNVDGRLIHKGGVMELTTDDRRVVRIVYRLPKQLTALPELTASGRLDFSDRTTPAGANRQLVVSTDGAPLVGEVWLNSSSAITVDFAPGVRLSQRSGPTEDLQRLPVDVAQGGGDQTVPVGAVTLVKTVTGVVQILVEASYRVLPSDQVGQDQGAYILHAWLLRSGG